MDLGALTAPGSVLAAFVDAEWYRSCYPDVAAAGAEPLHHYLYHGASEGRNPNPWFDGGWYAKHYPDVQISGMNPLVHYLKHGAAELRNPHPKFNAAWYVSQHPEAVNNPLLHHVLYGRIQDWPIDRPLRIDDYLPAPSVAGPRSRVRPLVDVIVPVYRGEAQTKRCLTSVLNDRQRPPGQIIVIDDRSPEPQLTKWLVGLAVAGKITLLRNKKNLGFVASTNRGLIAAGDHDVVLLNSDTEVPAGWLNRLATHAYSAPNIASVSPLSNNATICSYPSVAGGGLRSGMTLAILDNACKEGNNTRSIDVPTTVGFCMYIRGAALTEIGLLDEGAFGRGYGEENDFCMRATGKGWRHLLACDVFVYHEGSVSFKSDTVSLAAEGMKVLLQRYPGYDRLIARHVQLDDIAPFRFAVTAALFRLSKLPLILMISHELGGGVSRHINGLVQRLAHRANFLLLTTSPHGAVLSVPTLPEHPKIILGAASIADLGSILKSAGVSRLHIHHLMGMDLDVRGLIHYIGVPFDLTVHDYFALCPQTNLVSVHDGYYCGEPGPSLCNACIAERPSHDATDILSWRRTYDWQFLEADRVLCPSSDVRDRLAHYGYAGAAIIAPHEAVTAGFWPTAARSVVGRKLRIAILGVLAGHKGRHTVEAVTDLADPATTEFHLIGYPEKELTEGLAARLQVFGEYADEDLSAILLRIKPDVVWFPAPWPETYSYTLSAAIDAGLPIIASRIGAFQERIAGRPMSWLVNPNASTAAWVQVFESVRATLARGRPTEIPIARPAIADFYATQYLSPSPRLSRGKGGLIDLRRDGRLSVVVVPERLSDGGFSPCAHIRLLQPLDHPQINGDFDIVIADAEEALRYRADVIVTQRHAVPDTAAGVALVRHSRANQTALVYDIDDDLLDVPRDHADFEELHGKSKLVKYLVANASSVWVSTPALAKRVEISAREVRLIANGLDERIWADLPTPAPCRNGSIRILCMGTATHDADLNLVLPALLRLDAALGSGISVHLIGFTTNQNLPHWISRPDMSVNACKSYPGFVNWITQQPGWHIGLAPLVATSFNESKSAIKTLDYAALGLAVLASDVTAYQGSIADGPGGVLVANDSAAWFDQLRRLTHDGVLRRDLATGGKAALNDHTLAAQAALRRSAWLSLTDNIATKRLRKTHGAPLLSSAGRR